MKKKVVALLAAATILGTGSVGHAKYVNYEVEYEGLRGNNTIDLADGFVYSTEYRTGRYPGLTIVGTVNSNDRIDWISVAGYEGDGYAIGKFELDLYSTGIDADMSIYDESGRLLYTGVAGEDQKTVDNIFIGDGEELFVKIEYKSGAIERPYMLNVRYRDLNRSSIQNISSDLKNELIERNIIDSNGEILDEILESNEDKKIETFQKVLDIEQSNEIEEEDTLEE